MPDVTYMNPGGIADPSPSGFTAVVKVGNTVYIAGMVAQDENGQVVGEGRRRSPDPPDLAQHRRSRAGRPAAAWTTSSKTTTYVTGIEHAPAVRAVRNELFASKPAPPARSWS